MFFGKTPDCVCRVCDVMISSSHTVDQIPGGIHWDRSLSGPPGRTPSCRWSDVASWCSGWSGHAPPETTQDTAKEDLQFFFKQAELLQFCQCFYTLKRQSSEPKNTFWCWTTMQRVFQSFNIFVQMETICSRWEIGAVRQWQFVQSALISHCQEYRKLVEPDSKYFG